MIMKMNNHFFRLTAFALLIAVGLLAGCSKSNARTATYEFTNIRRGSVERTVSASGTIKPVSTVTVLPQMSGKVEKVYVDYNDTVNVGDILAELNTDVLKLKREQQYAAVSKVRANFELQLINFASQEALAAKNLISEYELKQSKTQLDGQAADLAVAEANLKEVETEINRYAYITSPINGIVLDRNINIGDTVVDNSSKIFTLAENLREMQIEATVGELDVTAISKGQSVRFTLESLPGRTFSGVVETLRMVPITSNGVVSYTVIISVENHDSALMPGMTCAVDFIVERLENVLLVSNAALRYSPTNLSAEQIEEMVFNAGLNDMSEEQRQMAVNARSESQNQTRTQNQQAPAGGGGLAGLLGGGPMMGGGAFGGQRPGGGQGQGNSSRETVVIKNLWYVNADGKLEVMQVRTGVSNGSNTAIYSEDLEGMQVILRERI